MEFEDLFSLFVFLAGNIISCNLIFLSRARRVLLTLVLAQEFVHGVAVVAKDVSKFVKYERDISGVKVIPQDYSLLGPCNSVYNTENPCSTIKLSNGGSCSFSSPLHSLSVSWLVLRVVLW